MGSATPIVFLILGLIIVVFGTTANDGNGSMVLLILGAMILLSGLVLFLMKLKKKEG